MRPGLTHSPGFLYVLAYAGKNPCPMILKKV